MPTPFPRFIPRPSRRALQLRVRIITFLKGCLSPQFTELQGLASEPGDAQMLQRNTPKATPQQNHNFYPCFELTTAEFQSRGLKRIDCLENFSSSGTVWHKL